MMRLQRGVALITALLVVALATTIAVAMASRQQVDIRRSGNLLQFEQAALYVEGMEGWAGRVLYLDAQNNQIDHRKEAWATELPPMPVEGGQIAGGIEDLNARFNLNMLYSNGQVNAIAVESFRRLLVALELQPGITDALLDWLDEDLQQRFPDGAEDDVYLLSTQPYRVANTPLVSSSELLLLAGVEVDDLAALLPYVTALPATTTINVNTASPEVLMALVQGLSMVDAEALVDGRGDNGYADMAAFTQRPELVGKNVPTELLAVSSDYFMVTSQVQFGRVTTSFQSMLYRDMQTGTHVIRRAQGAL